MEKRVLLPTETILLEPGVCAGGWWHTHPADPERIICDLCPRACSLKAGDRGFCFVRENRDGQMALTTYGRSTGFCIDPVEKKPLNHFFPGTSILSFGTAGCNLGCKFCQNWSISKSREVEKASESADAATIARAALELGCHSVAFTYNDPVIWTEYARDVARECRVQGVRTVAVTAGYITAEARAPFFEFIDAANVDLKAFSEQFYQQLTLSHLQPVLETLEWLVKETPVWLEITNLVIPQANDDTHEFRQMCDWILEHLGPAVPLHFTAFHPDFRLRDRSATPIETLLRARELAIQAGLQFVYVGNVHDPRHQSTYCPACHTCVIERDWYELGAYHLRGNRCAKCGTVIPGHFAEKAGDWGRKRQAVQINSFRQEPVTNPLSWLSSSKRDAPPVRIEAQVKQEIDMQLNPEQEQCLVRTAAFHIASAAARVSLQLEDSQLKGLADRPVIGCFVTLKRQQQLRACCGFLGNTMPLNEAIAHASVNTAVRDERFAPIVPRELAALDLGLSILHSLQRVTVPPSLRASAIEIGRHGLQIHGQGKRGLLLPNVATEHQFSPEEFLRQVCLKAGLPADAWRQANTDLFSFQSIIMEHPFPRDIARQISAHESFAISPDQVNALRDFCWQNLVLTIRGGTPGYYLLDCPDGMVTGVALHLQTPHGDAWQAGKLVLRPGVPLQATLTELTRRAAEWLVQTAPASWESCRLNLTILHDAIHRGTLQDLDLREWNSNRESALVYSRDRYAWCWSPAQPPQDAFHQAGRTAGMMKHTNAACLGLLTESTATSALFSNVPEAVGGPSVRPPAVAGTFYPLHRDQLQREVVEAFAPFEHIRPAAHTAAMVPHAGWKYSGRIAAHVLRHLQVPNHVIILGPKHTRQGVNWAVAPQSHWAFPGGTLPADPHLANRLTSYIPGLQLDAAAHAQEHSVEVILPLLAHVAPHAIVTGVAIGTASLEECVAFADGLSQAIRLLTPKPLLLISSDMNHFANDAHTRKVDRLAIDAMMTGDPAQLYNTVREQQISMCGVLPAVIVMECLRNLGARVQVTPVAYGTSADTTGDPTRVVGYAGLLLDTPSLSPTQ